MGNSVRELRTIHPFPARMAPDVARSALDRVPKDGWVLDPRCGSGTVPRAAVEVGRKCVGMDIDPLAVLMSRVWTTPVDVRQIGADAEEVSQQARDLARGGVRAIRDDETKRFISYWFGPKQKAALARLSTVLGGREDETTEPLMVALSRIIISKEMMASLARDTSHSRPHKVAEKNDFDVYAGFVRAAKLIGARLEPERIAASADIRCGDARDLKELTDHRFDLVLTSPPYLNAIDYLRGHRLALVWLGHMLESLRIIRAASVGAERMMMECETEIDISPFVIETDGSSIERRHRGWIRRYAADLDKVLAELHKVISETGSVVMVLGNSFIRGATINNAGLVEALARSNGFVLEGRRVREIPARRRYLPAPGPGSNALDTRMRTETVLTLRLG